MADNDPCPVCGKVWRHGDCSTTTSRRARCALTPEEPGLTHEQLGLIWMSAYAFNIGIGARENRDVESFAEMDDALDCMKRLFNITVDG